MNDNQVKFLPYHAINEFMVPEYRLAVLQAVLSGFDRLPGERRSAINNLIKRHVQVPGFRNSVQAPATIKARSAVTTFERRPEFVAQVLQAWTELHPELRQQVHDFLQAREWEVLPPEADRTKLPGFQVTWPKGEDYDVLGEAFAAVYPDSHPDENDLRLMIVWLAGLLPYDMYEDGEDEEEASEASE